MTVRAQTAQIVNRKGSTHWPCNTLDTNQSRTYQSGRVVKVHGALWTRIVQLTVFWYMVFVVDSCFDIQLQRYVT